MSIERMRYAVMCELLLHEQGRVLQNRLLNSSGNLLFDQSVLEALSKFAKSGLPLKALTEPCRQVLPSDLGGCALYCGGCHQMRDSFLQR